MKSLTYKDAGVDTVRGQRFVEKIKPLAKKTDRSGVVKGIGSFGGLFRIDLQKYPDPILVAATDGVGTKLKIATMAKKHTTIGIDLVAMCVNDVLAMGAEPLFFLDYFATSKLNVHQATEVISGIADGCLEAGCALLGGETAEMPSMYQDGDYDLAGFATGVVNREKIVDGSDIGLGNVVIGLASSGLHSNGFSLVRKILFQKQALDIESEVTLLKAKLSDVLLEPTRIYVKVVLPLFKQFHIRGMVHVTGGGFYENIPRVLPKECAVEIDKKSWSIPPIFTFIQKKGNVSETEMLKTFNCGIGFILIVPENEASNIVQTLKNLKQPSSIIGRVIRRKGPSVVFR